jgi:transposase-like protein
VPKREYSFALRKDAEDLYIKEQKTIEEISTATGVSISQVQRWAKEETWKEGKEKFQERINKAREDTRVLMREEILIEDLVHQRDLMKKYFEGKEVMEKADTQMMYAYTNVTDSICKILADMRKRDEALRSVQKVDRPQLFLDFMRDLVSFLKDRDPAGLESLEKNFDEFISFAKQKYS